MKAKAKAIRREYQRGMPTRNGKPHAAVVYQDSTVRRTWRLRGLADPVALRPEAGRLPTPAGCKAPGGPGPSGAPRA